MNRINFSTLVLAILVTAFNASVSRAAKKPAPELQSLIDAERSFARTSGEKGIRDSFLEFLAEESIVFRPDPVDARKVYGAVERIPGMLSWEPAFAEISAAGDMGYTTGPYEYRSEEGGEAPILNGYYISLWEKQADGEWKVLLDIGTNNPPPKPEWEKLAFRNPKPSGSGEEMSWEDRRERGLTALHDGEIILATRAGSEGLPDAYRPLAAGDILMFRNDEHPFTGIRKAVRFLPRGPVEFMAEIAGSGISRSGDLGYTYGTGHVIRKKTRREGPENFSFLRIWRAEKRGEFRIAVDVLLPIPAPESGSS